MKFTEFVRKNQNVITGTRSTRISESIPISEAREKFYSDEQFTKYDVVESEGKKLRILEKCSNYYACVDESGNVVRKFAKALTLTEDTGSMWTDSPNPFSFHGYTPSETFQENKELRQEWFSKMSQLDENTDDIALLKELKEADKKVPMETDYKLRDKLTIAKLIADAVGIPHDPLSTPENLVNAAIRKARKDPALMRNKAVLANMLEIAKSVGIRFSDSTFEVKEDVLNEDPLNAWKNRMKAAGAVHYISGKHQSGTTASKLHAYKIVDGKKVKVGAFDQVGRRGIAEDTVDESLTKEYHHRMYLRAIKIGDGALAKHHAQIRDSLKEDTLEEGKEEKIKQLLQDYKDKIRWSEEEHDPQKKTQHRIGAMKIKDHLKKQYGHNLTEDTLDELNIDTVKSYSEKAKTAPAKSLDKAIKRFGGQERAQDRIHTDALKKMTDRLKESEELEEGKIRDAEDAIKRHDQRKVEHEKQYGPMAAHELHSHGVIRKHLLVKKSRASASFQKKEDLKEAEELVEKFGVFRKGGSIGDNKQATPVKVHDTAEDAKAHAKRLNKLLSPGEKNYYGMKYHTKPVSEEVDEGIVTKTADGIRHTGTKGYGNDPEKEEADYLNKSRQGTADKNMEIYHKKAKPTKTGVGSVHQNEEVEPLTLKSLRKKLEMDVPAPDENNYAAKNKEMMGGEPTDDTPEMPDDNTGMTPDAISFRDIVKKLNATMVPKSEVTAAPDNLPHGNAMNPTSDTHRKQLIRKLQGN